MSAGRARSKISAEGALPLAEFTAAGQSWSESDDDGTLIIRGAQVGSRRNALSSPEVNRRCTTDSPPVVHFFYADDEEAVSAH